MLLRRLYSNLRKITSRRTMGRSRALERRRRTGIKLLADTDDIGFD